MNNDFDFDIHINTIPEFLKQLKPISHPQRHIRQCLVLNNIANRFMHLSALIRDGNISTNWTLPYIIQTIQQKNKPDCMIISIDEPIIPINISKSKSKSKYILPNISTLFFSISISLKKSGIIALNPTHLFIIEQNIILQYLDDCFPISTLFNDFPIWLSTTWNRTYGLAIWFILAYTLKNNVISETSIDELVDIIQINSNNNHNFENIPDIISYVRQFINKTSTEILNNAIQNVNIWNDFIFHIWYISYSVK